MGIPIDWKPTTASLQHIHRQLTTGGEGWPEPDVDVPPITDEQRRRARDRWSERVRATYVSVGQANSLLQQFVALGAPVEVLTGAAYTTKELTLQLSANLHLLKSLAPPSLFAPQALAPRQVEEPRWQLVLEQAIELFTFNLSLSQPVYHALYAVSSDPAFSQLSGIVADNLSELTTFGDLTIQWLHESRNSSPSLLETKTPRLLAAYESLLYGGPETLDDLAGQEITVETRPGNLGTLSAEQSAAIFYDTVQNTILPRLESLGVDPSEAWQRRHRDIDTASLPPAVVAGVGIGF